MEKSKPETIIEFADKIEALAKVLDISNAEFVYVLECLKQKIINIILNNNQER